MEMFQCTLSLLPKKRGFHLITGEIIQALPKIKTVTIGMCNVFIRHTSASLTINENADPTVRKDLIGWFNKAVPENANYLHNDEGADDMPAHIKSSLLDSSLNIPIQNGRLALGIWQGIYLCEHRDNGGERSLVLTVWGK